MSYLSHIDDYYIWDVTDELERRDFQEAEREELSQEGRQQVDLMSGPVREADIPIDESDFLPKHVGLDDRDLPF